ncbi:DUF5700 domain-containing putative Zn-dependent protease [Psychroserpens algicola]|uniref:DUF2268 domain-containing protein n=1 Tax=Psychroserpens algicola TaxID=1719034 RepID=A0ABT0H5Y4_9FLAO|nr:DUF5700 domain-containing putative Zn-dependent protease [Psychroserpens algicola]MCK8479792.1 hypothetical protein [Psychroserpens algicola]
MKQALIFLALMIYTSSESIAQNVNLEFDFKNVHAALELISNGKLNILSDKQFLELPGTKGMLDHDSKFNNKMSKDQYLAELKTANFKPDAFGINDIRKNINSIKRLVNQISSRSDYIKKLIESQISNYLPNTQLPKTTVYFVLGGNSDGYTDGNSFYIELQYFNGLEGLALLISHEIYHIYQQKLNPFFLKLLNMPTASQINYVIPINTYMEGVASYIANPLLINNPDKYVEFNQRKYKRNFKRIKESFLLFESLINYSKEVDSSQLNSIYNIGFSGNWDSPLYFVGFEICAQIEKEYGEYSIREYINKVPTQLFIDYINLYRRKEKNIPLRFSLKTEELIQELHKNLIME